MAAAAGVAGGGRGDGLEDIRSKTGCATLQNQGAISGAFALEIGHLKSQGVLFSQGVACAISGSNLR